MRSCLLASALVVCACGGSSDDATWEVVAQDQPSSLLSVWASSSTDVWVVGGDRKDGTGPIVEHYDGTAWTAMPTGITGVDLWWVFGFKDGPVFMSGTGGTILRYQNGTFDQLTTPGTLTVFGMWGASPTDLWAVGGNASGGGFAWRFDGTTWTNDADVPADITAQGTIWKVGGRAANDIWMSGSAGTMLHWNGSSLDRTDVMVDAPLLSVAGNDEFFATVGGQFAGVLYENDGSGWKSKISQSGPLLTGVAVSDAGAYAVGQYGSVLHRDDGGTWNIEKAVTQENLHGAYIDPDGGVWAAGGKFDTAPLTSGVLLHKGAALKGTF